MAKPQPLDAVDLDMIGVRRLQRNTSLLLNERPCKRSSGWESREATLGRDEIHPNCTPVEALYS